MRPSRIAATVAAVAALGVLPTCGDDDAAPATTATEPATTSSPSTTAPSTTTTAAPATTAPVDPALATAVWPWAGSDVRYTDPVDAARGFAVDLVGFVDPLVGEFRAGDSRSGEVEVRSVATFAPTTVFVRQLGDDATWWVIGSATENIVVDRPDALDSITSPLTVAGSATAWEGTVQVAIRADGVDDPLFEGFVTASGTPGELGPFEQTLDWPAPPSGAGALVLTTTSSEDGRVMEAGVLRVSFG